MLVYTPEVTRFPDLRAPRPAHSRITWLTSSPGGSHPATQGTPHRGCGPPRVRTISLPTRPARVLTQPPLAVFLFKCRPCVPPWRLMRTVTIGSSPRRQAPTSTSDRLSVFLPAMGAHMGANLFIVRQLPCSQGTHTAPSDPLALPSPCRILNMRLWYRRYLGTLR